MDKIKILNDLSCLEQIQDACRWQYLARSMQPSNEVADSNTALGLYISNIANHCKNAPWTQNQNSIERTADSNQLL